MPGMDRGPTIMISNTFWHGKSVLVTGGSSGIGLTAIQLAKQIDATVFTTAGSDDKAAYCRSLGADHAFNYRTQDFVAEIARITGKRGVDVVLDMVGGDYIEKNLKCLALEGRLLLIAFLRLPLLLLLLFAAGA